MNKRKSKKQTWQMAKSLLEFRIQSMEMEYNKLGKDFASCVVDGVIQNNIYTLDWLRQMTFLYTDIAAHKHTLSSMNYEI